MSYTKKVEHLSNYERCLTNKTDYAKYNDIIIYKWEYITTQDIEKIKDATSHNIEDILGDFVIPIIYTDDLWRPTLDVSPLLMINLTQSMDEIKEEKEWKSNFITVTTNHNKERIFEFLVTDFYEGLLIEDTDNHIMILLHQLYINIENTLNNPDIDNQMENYKTQKNLKHRLNEDKNKIKNPIIKIQLDQIMLYIHEFVDSLDTNIQSEIFKNIKWKWRSTIIKNSKEYLYNKYHTKELNYIMYQDYLTQFNYSIEQLYYSLEGAKLEVEEWVEVPRTNYYIEKLRSDILQYIEWIQIESNDDDEVEVILNDIDEKLFDRFLRDYHDLEEDDDTWFQSRFLADDFSNISSYLRQLIKNKDHQYIETQKWSEETTDISSANDLFKKIKRYKESGDNQNLTPSINKLQECDETEIKDLLSQNELEELLEILTQEEEYEFAARIGRILGIDTA